MQEQELNLPPTLPVKIFSIDTKGLNPSFIELSDIEQLIEEVINARL